MKKLVFKIAAIIFFLFSTNLIAQTSYKLSDTVNDFSLKNVDGKMVSLAHYNNVNGFLLVFYDHQCQLSLAYENRIIALNAKYASKGFPVLAINPSSTTIKTDNILETMIAYGKSKTLNFPYLLDENQEITAAFGVKSTPQVYILQNTKNGFMIVFSGFIDNDTEDINGTNSEKYVENALEQLIVGDKITINQTNFIGCPIK